jgi:hypothetical protein
MRLTHRSPRTKGAFHYPPFCGLVNLNLGLEFCPLYLSAPEHLHWAGLCRSRCVISVPLTLIYLDICADLTCVLFRFSKRRSATDGSMKRRLRGPWHHITPHHWCIEIYPCFYILSLSRYLLRRFRGLSSWNVMMDNHLDRSRLSTAIKLKF